MSGFFSLRRLTTAAILVSAVSGVSLAQTMTPTPAAAPAATPATLPSTSGPAMPPPGTMPSLGDPIAVINGLPVNNKAFYDILMQVAGMRVFQQVLDLTLVQKACQDAGVELSGPSFSKRLEDELTKTMDGLNIKAADGKPAMTKEERLAALSNIVQQQGITGVEFRLGLETRAELRAMSEGKIEVTAEELSDAYQSEYGEKRKVHIITYGEKDSPVAIKAALNAKKPDGTYKTAEEVAKDLNLPQPAIWVISKNAKNVDVIKGVVFDYLKAPREISAETEVPVNATTKQKVLIMLDEVTPDKTSPTGPTVAIKDELTKKVFDFKQSQWMNNHLNGLRQRAQVEVKDPYLTEIYKQIADAQAKQQAAAATATAPAPLPVPAPATTRAATAPRNP